MRPPAPASVRERLRLRPWLEQQIQSGRYPGVHWLDRSAGVFQIPWKHAARHGWSIDRDASLFRSWAMYTGKYIPDRDKPDPKTWKANFRCALNSLSDVRELSEQSLKKGSLASRVYMLLPSRAKGRRRRGLSSGLSLSAQGWEAAVKVHPDPQSSSCVPLDRIPDMFFRSRGFQEVSGPFHARTRERLPPYSIIKQEEATTEEQISSYCSSSTTEEQISSYCSSSTTEEQTSSYCSSSTTDEQISSYCSSSTTDEQISSYCSSSTTEEQISSYCSSSTTEEQISSSFHLLSKGFSCTPQTQRTWDSPSAQPEQAEAVLKIVDQLSCSDVWGQSEEPRYWRPSGSFWEDGFSGDLDPLISAPCPLQMDSYWPSPSLRASVEPCTPGLSQ